MSKISTAVQNFVKNLKPDTHIAVGLSGGSDSVCLLHALAQIKESHALTITAAHLNHGWRTTAERDEIFCKELCKQLNVPLIIGHKDEFTYAAQQRGSREDYGRQLRRAFFDHVVAQTGAHYIALAHHQDDQIETFFIRLIRGSQIDGLVGMKVIDEQYIRPLLTVTKDDIVAYLTEHQLTWCHDETNDSPEFLRNRIRHELMPLLNNIDPRISIHIPRTMSLLDKASAQLQTMTEALLAPLQDADRSLDIAQLCEQSNYMQKRLIMTWLIDHDILFEPTDAFLTELLRFIHTAKPGSRHESSPTWRLYKTATRLYLQIP